jgi:NADPH2:quinone reductase
VSFGDAGREQSWALDTSSMRGQNQALTSYFLGAELFLGTRAHALIETILDDVAKGTLRVVLDRTFPLADAEQAHAYIESRRAFGRVLLVP